MDPAPFYCAIDTTDLAQAVRLAEQVGDTCAGIKLGKEFVTAHGPPGVHRIGSMAQSIFLDLKFHDIPNTVAGAVRAAAGVGCALLTVHAAGGPAMLRAAVSAAEEYGPPRPLIVAVTVLTSFDEDDLDATGQRGPIREQVLRLARLAQSAGLDGLVCSPLEVADLRIALGPDVKLVVPGVRPTWTRSDDQKRVMTPAEAKAAGADLLVIGRPITQADDPRAAALRIADELTP